ncbi:MAG: LysR family transcriptional regulator [Alphaproteobacteria bacterium 65-7]|nr:MAG: LysR family transcriptional regulator [Alphaproteobacteria bacterium 65-7]
MADRLTGIEIFVRAVTLGSLSAAARDIGMSPAMAAKHLNALETRLGVTLVNRTTRRLSLTEAGEIYLDKAEAILADLREAEAEVSARTRKVEGLLRVSAPAAFGALHLGEIIAAFHRQYPAVTVEVGLSDRYVDLLEERWDTAIRIGKLADSGLVARKLADVRLNICASPAYLAARGTPRTLSDLTGHDCLGYTLSPLTGASHWGFGIDGRIRQPVRGSLHANNGEILVQAALAGAGLVYGPRFLTANAVADGRLVEVTFDMPLMEMGAIHAITHATRRPAAKTRAWIDFLSHRLRELAVNW